MSKKPKIDHEYHAGKDRMTITIKRYSPSKKFHVLGGGYLDDVVADPAVDRSHEGKLHRPFDIAEQDDAADIRRVLGAVNEGLVEHEGLPVAPNAFHAIDQDPALVGVGRDQPEMIAQCLISRIEVERSPPPYTELIATGRHPSMGTDLTPAGVN